MNRYITGSTIKALREKRHMTQVQLAEKLRERGMEPLYRELELPLTPVLPELLPLPPVLPELLPLPSALPPDVVPVGVRKASFSPP